MISYSHRAEIVESQMQNLGLEMAELQHRLNPQPSWGSDVKVRSLTENNGLLRVGMGMCGMTI